MSVKYKIRDQHGLNYLTCTICGWVDLFTRAEYRDIVLDSWRYCTEHKGLQIWGYVIMSNHPLAHRLSNPYPRWRTGCPPLNPSGAGARLCRVPLIRAGYASKRNEQNLISKNRIQALVMIGYTNCTSRRVKFSIQPYSCRHSRRE
jgi:hypothetical protein